MRRHAVEALAASAVALFLTLAIAAPVVRTPSERIFGLDIVGWHHDPFTVMQQFARPLRPGVYFQPVTDLTGAAFARVAGPVAACAGSSFRFSAVGRGRLSAARHLACHRPARCWPHCCSPFPPVARGLSPHIAQTQWLPL